MYTFGCYEQICIGNCAFKMSLTPSKNDTKVNRYEIQRFSLVDCQKITAGGSLQTNTIFSPIFNKKQLSRCKNYFYHIHLKFNCASNGKRLTLCYWQCIEVSLIRSCFFQFLGKQRYLRYFILNIIHKKYNYIL